MSNRVSCRLPQTPRTPSAGMSHYFDDILHRSVDLGRRSSFTARRLRRSSTGRSIGARSDFDGSVNGYDDDAQSTANSVFTEDPDRTKDRDEADIHMHQYISDQLNRFRVEGQGDDTDEYETKA